MKRLFLFFAVAGLAVSCEKEHVAPAPEPRDPNDVSGFYDVDYKMSIDGVDVSFDVIPGRIEVDAEEGTVDFYPDNAILKFPTFSTGLTMWNVEFTDGNMSLRDNELHVSLEVTERHHTSGTLTMTGTIVGKPVVEWGVSDSPGYEGYYTVCYNSVNNYDGSTGYHPYYYPAPGPGYYHRLKMTIEMQVLDPSLPSGTQVFPETGEGFRKYRIEITGK